jgi:peptide/nickel transport system substrate-binding protein
MRRTFIGVLGFLAAASCGADKPSPPAAGGQAADPVVLYARGDQTDTLDPQATDWGGSAKILVNIYETLVTFSADGVDLVPGLAERWQRSDDGKTWTFHLRKGVLFHDGTAFTSASVRFTLDRLLGRGPHVPRSNPYGPQYADIDTVEAPEPHTVVITLKAPSAVFLMNLAMFPAGIVSVEAMKKHRDQFGRNPVGTGPLKFKLWDPGVKIVLERNDAYWGAKAKMSRLIILDVKDVQVAIQKLKKGEVHIVDHITLADVPVIEADPNLAMEYEVSMNVCYLGFNLRKAPYDDPNFRRAVAHAIDRKKVLEIAYQGRAEVAPTLVPPSVFPIPEGLPPYAYDPVKAKEFLAKVKLPPDFQPVIWHMTYPRPYVPEPDKLAQVLQDDLSRIGLKVRLEGFNVDIYSKKLRDLEHPMFLLGWSADIADPDNFLYALLHGDSIGPLDKPSGTNHPFFNHPEFNRIVKAAQSEVDAAKRWAMYTEALGIYRSEIPTFPLVHVKQMAAVSKKVRYNHHPIEYRFWNIELVP